MVFKPFRSLNSFFHVSQDCIVIFIFHYCYIIIFQSSLVSDCSVSYLRYGSDRDFESIWFLVRSYLSAPLCLLASFYCVAFFRYFFGLPTDHWYASLENFSQYSSFRSFILLLTLSFTSLYLLESCIDFVFLHLDRLLLFLRLRS